jgi:putative ABC transport system permease protein
MPRLAFWLRWSLRDLRQRWAVVTAIALTVALGTGAYAGLGSLESWRTLSNDASFALLDTHDLHVTLNTGSYVPEGALAAGARSIPDAAALNAVEERLIVPTQVDASLSDKALLVPGRLVGVPVGQGGPHVDGIYANKGRGLAPADAGRAVAVLDYNFGLAHDLPAAGALRLGGDRPLAYVGQGLSPEYFRLTTDVAILRGRGNYAVLFVPLETAQRLSGHAGAVNDLVLTLKPGADRAAVQSQLEQRLTTRLPEVGFETETKEEIDAYRVLYTDAEGDQTIFTAFALLLLAAGTFAAFNLASRIVEAERREIGIGMALGASPRTNAIRPLLLGAEIGVLGVAFGIPIGLWLGRAFMSVMQTAAPLPVWRMPLEPRTFAVAAILGLVLPLLATAYPTWRAVRVPPVQAIEAGYRSARGGGLAPWLKRVPLPGRSFARMPVRNVLRTPRRTVLTVLGIAAAITAVTAALGLVDSFRETVDRGRAFSLAQSPTRFAVDLAGFVPSSSAPVRAIATDPLVEHAEQSLQLWGTLRAGSESISALVELQDAASTVWRPTLSAGSFRPGTPGVVLTEEAARDLGVDVGQTVVLRHPVRAGPTALRTVERRVRVVGLTPHPFRFFVYMDASQARLFGLAGLTNLVNVVPRHGASADELKRSLFTVPGVVSAQPVSATTDAMETVIAQISDVIAFTGVVALLLALLIAFNNTRPGPSCAWRWSRAC